MGTERTRFFYRILSAALLFGVSGNAEDLGASDSPASSRTSLKVLVSTSEAPEVRVWAATAQKLVAKWHPIIANMLKTPGFTPTSEVKLDFKKDMKGIAFTSGDTITISADHILHHPDDFGMVIHELTHVLQRYPKFDKDTWWLVEGIADYVRIYRFEPNAKLPRIDVVKASYRDGYKTSARFLAWIERRHDKKIITELNLALRKGTYKPELFEERTGKNLEQLWAEFVKALARQ